MAVVQRPRDPFSWPELVLPWEILRALAVHGALLRQFTLRDILARYRGSYLGVAWSLLRPLGMLTVYVAVFGFILRPQLGDGVGTTKLDFALSMFCGLILFDFFAESVGRAPTLVVSKPNFVTKVVFPLEILSLSAVAAALVQLVISLVPFIGGVLLVRGVPATALLLPLVIAPLICLALGVSWLLSSLGVFVRDLNAAVPVLLTVLMFASAIFYSLESVPAEWRWLFELNPIAVLVDDARRVLLLGQTPAWGRLGGTYAAGVLVAVGGYAFFMRTKRGFADVI